MIRAVEQGEVKVAAAVAFAKDVPLQDQARLIVESGSPLSAVKAAVKAKADRALYGSQSRFLIPKRPPTGPSAGVSSTVRDVRS